AGKRSCHQKGRKRAYHDRSECNREFYACNFLREEFSGKPANNCRIRIRRITHMAYWIEARFLRIAVLQQQMHILDWEDRVLRAVDQQQLCTSLIEDTLPQE